MQRMVWLPGRHLLCLVTAWLACSPIPGLAQEDEPEDRPPLTTDRPDFTENPLVLFHRTLQIESGFTYEKGSDGVKFFNAPETLLRYGAWEKTELRLGLPNYFRAWRSGASTSGFSDTYLGLKHQLVGSDRPLTLALMPGITVPTGSGAFTTGAVDPEVQFIWGRGLDDRTDLAGLFAGFWTKDGAEREFTWRATVSVARSLGGPWGTFLEYAGDYFPGSGDSHVVHNGFTYAVTPDSQVDLHYGFGLSRAAPDFFIGAGYVVRFW